MKKKVETNSQLKQSNALSNYLDEMLHDATELASGAVDQPVRNQVKLESLERALLAEVAIKDTTPEQKQVIKLNKVERAQVSNIIGMTKRSSDELESEPEVVLVEEVLVEDDPKSHPAKPSNRIDTGHFPIQCLMFRVGHNLLSLPLIEMNGVVPWTDELTQLPQSSDCILGILKHRNTNLRVLNSSKVLGIPAITAQKPSHILLLSDSASAISCDTLEDVVTLEYNDIQWQPVTGNALMHGTIRETLAYLLSPSGIIDSLDNESEL